MESFQRQRTFSLLLIIASFYITTVATAFQGKDSSYAVQKELALKYISSLTPLQQSTYWPNVDVRYFLTNLKANVEDPLSIYEGRGTNFCAYAALSYIPLNTDPLLFTKVMITLYEEGKATIGAVTLTPSLRVREAAGTFHFKGRLDLRPADQLWFLTLADHFKCYLNIFNHKYDPGDEDGFWASTNYAKFNRMIRKLFNYNVDASGKDLLHPHISDMVGYLKNCLQSGITFIYLNNTFLTKKKHGFKLNLPTHFVVLLSIEETAGKVKISFWDYGGITLQELTPDFLKTIIFGISHCTRK